jgi:hypothetical protein
LPNSRSRSSAPTSRIHILPYPPVSSSITISASRQSNPQPRFISFLPYTTPCYHTVPHFSQCAPPSSTPSTHAVSNTQTPNKTRLTLPVLASVVNRVAQAVVMLWWRKSASLRGTSPMGAWVSIRGSGACVQGTSPIGGWASIRT